MPFGQYWFSYTHLNPQSFQFHFIIICQATLSRAASRYAPNLISNCSCIFKPVVLSCPVQSNARYLVFVALMMQLLGFLLPIALMLSTMLILFLLPLLLLRSRNTFMQAIKWECERAPHKTAHRTDFTDEHCRKYSNSLYCAVGISESKQSLSGCHCKCRSEGEWKYEKRFLCSLRIQSELSVLFFSLCGMWPMMSISLSHSSSIWTFVPNRIRKSCSYSRPEFWVSDDDDRVLTNFWLFQLIRIHHHIVRCWVTTLMVAVH